MSSALLKNDAEVDVNIVSQVTKYIWWQLYLEGNGELRHELRVGADRNHTHDGLH